jgi:hypothetical protein
VPGGEGMKGAWAARLLWAIPALLGVSLTAISARSGFAYDDIALRRAVQGHSLLASKAPFDLFLTMPGIPEWNRAAREAGMLPWFASERLRIAPLRPLASLSHTIDFTLWPGWPVIMHLQNIVLYALVVAVVCFLYKKMIRPAWAALLAGCLFACNDGHGVAVGWISCRSSLLAAAFGLLALLLHHRWRSEGWLPGKYFGPLALAIGLLSSELAIGVAGYLIAYAAFLDEAPLRQRGRSLAGHAFVLIAWILFYRMMDGGARFSGMYVDPWTSPTGFVAAVRERAPTLLLMQFWNSVPSTGTALVLSGLAAVAILPLAVRDKHVRFWLVGMLLAVLPACGTVPQRRMLLIAGVGGFALMVSVVAALFTRSSLRLARLWWALPSSLVGLAWLAAHAVAAPWRLPSESVSMGDSGRAVDKLRDALKSGFPARQIVLLNSGNPLLVPMLVQGEEARGARLEVNALAFSRGAARVRRTAVDTLLVLLPEGLLRDPFARLFRSPADSMPAGFRVRLTTMEAVVVDPGDGAGPVAVEFRFPAPLESLDTAWVVENRGEIEAVELPLVGGEILLQPR